MAPTHAVDNDVLIKLSHFGLLAEFGGLLGGTGKVGVLGAAQYVVPKRILKQREDARDAVTAFEEFVEGLEVLEPSEDERQLAASLEELAARHALDLDSGESQLVSILVLRLMDMFLTGDKRAIHALEALHSDADSRIKSLEGRVACVEQLALALVGELGVDAVRSSICAAAFADRALSICFSCSSVTHEDSIREGLRSYIESLRRECVTVLAADAAVTAGN